MIVGIIGYRNHAGSILSILQNLKEVDKIKVYLYKKKVAKKAINIKKKTDYTYSIKTLFQCDAIFISSPTRTHQQYINLFLKKNIYIFCEKPGGNNIHDARFLEKLKTKNKKRIYINYNLLFSENFKIINNAIKNKKKYGKIIYIDIKLASGISYKKEFSNNWRFNSKNIFDQIAGNIGSHYINLLFWIFKNLYKKNMLKLNINKKRDTSLIVLKADKNALINLYFSYSTPLVDQISLFFTNAIININDNKVVVHEPRNIFDKNKNFISSPKKIIKTFNQNKEYSNSLRSSLRFFIEKVKKKENIPIKYFNNSVNTLKFFI